MPNSYLPGANGLVSDFAQSYNSFSGTDIKAVIGNNQFAELQGITVTVTREKAAIYTMGSPDPRAYSRNKRGIGGSLVWTNFDRDALMSLIWAAGGTFVANTDEVQPAFQFLTDSAQAQNSIFTSTLTIPALGQQGGPATTIDNLDSIPVNTVSALKSLASPWYADQILPFDVTLCANNEYGATAAMRIFGIEILTSAWGTSVEDSVSAMSAQYVARFVEPWMVVQSPFEQNND